MATEAEGEEFEVDPMDEDDEDETYDRETEEFYSNIQDAAGTGSSGRSKRALHFAGTGKRRWYGAEDSTKVLEIPRGHL